MPTFGQRSRAATPADRTWAPAIDVHETKDDLVVSVDLPGVKESDKAKRSTKAPPGGGAFAMNE